METNGKHTEGAQKTHRRHTGDAQKTYRRHTEGAQKAHRRRTGDIQKARKSTHRTHRTHTQGSRTAVKGTSNILTNQLKLLKSGGVQMAKEYKWGCPYGCHRVVEPEGVLPQAAWKIDNSPEIRENETLIDVETLNIDAASFKQILSQCDPDADEATKEQQVAARIMDIVSQRGRCTTRSPGQAGCFWAGSRNSGPRSKAETAPKSATGFAPWCLCRLRPSTSPRSKKCTSTRTR